MLRAATIFPLLRVPPSAPKINSGSSSGPEYCEPRFVISFVAICLLVGGIRQNRHHSELFLRESPFGQSDSCTEVATLDCCVGAITGNVHVSYCTTADRLKLDRTQKSARTLPSV